MFKKYSYLSCTSARPIGAEVDAGLTSVDPTDSGETQHTEPTIDSASSLQIVLVSLRTLLASEIINQIKKNYFRKNIRFTSFLKNFV